MKLSHLEITNFRNLKQVTLNLGHSINVFYGQNGSGKTSFLEAINYLGLGRSFRTRNLNRIIHQSSESLSIFSQLVDSGGIMLPAGIERKRESPSYFIKIAGKSANSLVELAEMLPFQLINANSHLLLTSGPLVRRQFLDWGVFHVEPSFYHYWQRANRAIKQRNAGLKSAKAYQEISLWDEELTSCAQHLDSFRSDYSKTLAPLAYSLLKNLLPTNDFKLKYAAGWNTQYSLKEILQDNFARDKQLGYTQQGPHRADLQLKTENVPAQDILSQGQQKLAAYALRLAQGGLLKTQTRKNTIFLIDDLPSELDSDKRSLIANIIKGLDSQVFVTGIEISNLIELLEPPATCVFHVEHGRITPA